MTMEALLEGWPSAREALVRRGMMCVGCPMARFETLGEAAAAYRLDAAALLAELAGAAHRARRRSSR